MYSNRLLHMAVQKQGGQLKPTYNSYVTIRGVALGINRKRWTIGRGGERGSGISVLMPRQDGDDDSIYICIDKIYPPKKKKKKKT